MHALVFFILFPEQHLVGVGFERTSGEVFGLLNTLKWKPGSAKVIKIKRLREAASCLALKTKKLVSKFNENCL